MLCYVCECFVEHVFLLNGGAFEHRVSSTGDVFRLEFVGKTNVVRFIVGFLLAVIAITVSDGEEASIAICILRSSVCTHCMSYFGKVITIMVIMLPIGLLNVLSFFCSRV